jgi:hypothetical protein
MSSLEAHSQLFKESYDIVQTKPTTTEEMDYYLYHAEQIYLPCAFNGDDFDSYDTFREEVFNLDPHHQAILIAFKPLPLGIGSVVPRLSFWTPLVLIHCGWKPNNVWRATMT